MRVIECAQLSPEWWTARRAIPTASNFDKIMTPKTRKYSEQAEGYIHELVAELIDQSPNYFTSLGRPISQAMQHGIDTEPDAVNWYEAKFNIDATRVGFCVSDCERWGCSPDALVGEDGGLELKCVQLKTQVKYLLDGVLPAEYAGQVHGSLIVTGRKWWDFLSYQPALPPLLIRVVPDTYTDALRTALEQFHKRYLEVLGRFSLTPRKAEAA